ncbi:MAG TPA: carboxypeptidase-like regulatory domain-containing protein [Pyrinomonadaceae bacterium]|nr:carboxypeptidase-like regulatory domain-containing protein [Pyrinomonadaceae bacterium]
MRIFAKHNKGIPALALIAAFVVCPTIQLSAAPSVPRNSSVDALGIIRGFVRDQSGNPIAGATVAIFRAGTSKLLKQVTSAVDGRFLAKIIPGRYSVLAVAQGFNPITLPDVQVGQAAQLEYGFKLERAGSGNTLPEKRVDRNNPKWAVRAAATSRSIYQNNEGSGPVAEETATVPDRTEPADGRKIQSVAATYFSSSDRGSFTGINFATLIPLKENADIILAAQTGIGAAAPQRIDAELKFKPVEDHQIRLKSSYGKLGNVVQDDEERTLGQLSIQATDEWKIKDGVILVYGFDFSRFTGAGNDVSISPRLGFQFDVDPKTRFRTAYTSQNEDRSWSRAIELEDAQIVFREPVSVEDLVVENGKPLMNRASRFEFGIERVLDNASSIEANAFSDTVFGRGVGFTFAPFDSADGDFAEFVGNQQGSSRGLRLVYSRRITGRLSATAGYSLGQGQRLSQNPISQPDKLFENGFFQTLFGQLEADLKTGTNVKTIFRLSPEATVFAIDPFQGRLTIYDPGLSILVTQSLPTWGLPFHAEAIIDARNLFDFRNGVFNEEGSLRANSGGKAIRGGILVRF